MSKYNKGIGAIVGGIIGIGLAAIGITETSAIPPDMEPVVASIVATITGALGAYFAPKNAD